MYPTKKPPTDSVGSFRLVPFRSVQIRFVLNRSADAARRRGGMRRLRNQLKVADHALPHTIAHFRTQFRTSADQSALPHTIRGTGTKKTKAGIDTTTLYRIINNIFRTSAQYSAEQQQKRRNRDSMQDTVLEKGSQASSCRAQHTYLTGCFVLRCTPGEPACKMRQSMRYSTQRAHCPL